MLRVLLQSTTGTHRAGGALDDLHRGVDVVGVQVGHLQFGDRDTCALVIFDRLQRDLRRPLSTPAAFSTNLAAGGVL